MNTARCDLNWKTCGHCRFGIDSHGKPYGSCDLVGFWGSLLGCDICLNAPPYCDYTDIIRKETKNQTSSCTEIYKKINEHKARMLREIIEDIEAEINKDDSKPLSQIKNMIDNAKFIVNKLCGDN